MDDVKMRNIDEANQLASILSALKTIGSTSFCNLEVSENSVIETEHTKLLSSIKEELNKLDEKLKDMTWLNSHLRILQDFGQTCTQTLNEQVLMEKAYELVSRVMPTDAFFIALHTEESPEIHFPFMADEGEILMPDIIPLDSNSFTAKVIKSKETIHAKTAEELDEFDETFGTGNQGKTCIFVPIIIDDKVKGVISAQSNQEFAYRKEHEELLQMIGNQVMSSIITAQLYSKNYKMSLTDEMTGLGNYRAFHSDLERLIQDRNPLALVMIDSDGLKGINDTYGHHAGDLYLKTLSAALKNIKLPDASVYRYSGDEFMIILKNPTMDNLSSIFTELRAYLINKPISINEADIFVSFSGGAAIYPDHAQSAEELKKTADHVLYMSKRMGKNQDMIYSGTGF
ncbi:diguanylate cyclase (GGDEF)-like protein [Peribacillus deserti]|uniref:Diguanylate cyclase (GGDEF)-like protein n=1 Tax=Peribacillus deserti TaxID=673318 RepID=A0ABS2QNU9_9BACI|nr:sensor domain-containing diguanylate cyclase [Peribacillus deserti]MBM7694384.1 diguanylate cyclase (GGDEF)-like protein [Peribacillus deserti]